MPPPTWCNCYAYAWRKRRREGGGILFVPSRRGWWFHAQHVSADGKTVSEFGEELGSP